MAWYGDPLDPLNQWALAQQQLNGAQLKSAISGTSYTAMNTMQGFYANVPGAVIGYPIPQAPTEKPKIQKIGGSIIAKLREEIDEWHGDILRAA